MINKLSLKQWKTLKDTLKKFILYVSIPGCCPCLVVERQLLEIQKSYADFEIYEYKIHDIENIKNDEIVQYYNLSPFPAVLFINNGEEVGRIVGEHPNEMVVECFNKLR